MRVTREKLIFLALSVLVRWSERAARGALCSMIKCLRQYLPPDSGIDEQQIISSGPVGALWFQGHRKRASSATLSQVSSRTP